MNSIERFYATVNREPVDRPACWMGMPTPSSIPGMCRHFGVQTLEELKASCGDDFYAVEVPYKSPTCSALYAAFDWYMNGSNVDTEHRTLTADGFFAKCEDLEDVMNADFPWPDPALYIDPAECRRLVDEAPKDKAIIGMVWACHFQDFCAAFGMQNALMNMKMEPEMVHFVDEKIVSFYEKALTIFLEATKGKVHAILIGDDLGSQLDLMIGPDMIEEFVIPGAKRLIDLAHSYGVKVIYHSCGAIFRAIPMLIEAGVDVIHPIQALAANMDAETLKKHFEGNGKLGPLPFSVYFIITTVVMLILMVVLRYTRLGRNICMVGGNLDTAWLAGVKSDMVTIVTFVISSTVCALGGALNGIYSGSASITMGEKGISPLMIALTATIIGGTSLSGGKGSVVWTWVALVAVSFLKSLCKKTEMQVLVIAAILIICIVYETAAQYRRDRVVGIRPNLHLEYLKEMSK